jgi:hypothetical protein
MVVTRPITEVAVEAVASGVFALARSLELGSS